MAVGSTTCLVQLWITLTLLLDQTCSLRHTAMVAHVFLA